MRRSVFSLFAAATVWLAVSSSPSKAQPHDWSGIYVGAHGGYAWSDTTWTHIDEFSGGGVAGLGGVGFDDLAPGDTNTHDQSGALYGGHVGLNYQTGVWVFGVEASLSDNENEGNSLDVQIVRARNETISTKISSLLTATARVGYASDRFLAYVKGGFATAKIEQTITSPPIQPGLASSEERHNGWMVGAGLEYALTDNIIIGAEYGYVDLDAERHIALVSNENNFPVSDGRTLQQTFDPNAIHTATVRVSLKLN